MEKEEVRLVDILPGVERFETQGAALFPVGKHWVVMDYEAMRAAHVYEDQNDALRRVLAYGERNSQGMSRAEEVYERWLRSEPGCTEKTARGYHRWWTEFAQWASERGRNILPATEETIEQWLDSLGAVRKGGSLSNMMTAIKHMHHTAGVPYPVKPGGALAERIAGEKKKGAGDPKDDAEGDEAPAAGTPPGDGAAPQAEGTSGGAPQAAAPKPGDGEAGTGEKTPPPWFGAGPAA